MQSLCERLWNASACLPETDTVRLRLLNRLYKSGLTPDSYFEARRMESGTEEPVNLYRCVLSQPLDEQWANFEGRLHDQDDWTEYHCLWGILGSDEETAEKIAKAEQAKCYHLPANLEKMECLGNYNEVPGTLWQGIRWHDKPAMKKNTNPIET
jgi:hypothetical protein